MGTVDEYLRRDDSADTLTGDPMKPRSLIPALAAIHAAHEMIPDGRPRKRRPKRATSRTDRTRDRQAKASRRRNRGTR